MCRRNGMTQQRTRRRKNRSADQQRNPGRLDTKILIFKSSPPPRSGLHTHTRAASSNVRSLFSSPSSLPTRSLSLLFSVSISVSVSTRVSAFYRFWPCFLLSTPKLPGQSMDTMDKTPYWTLFIDTRHWRCLRVGGAAPCVSPPIVVGGELILARVLPLDSGCGGLAPFGLGMVA